MQGSRPSSNPMPFVGPAERGTRCERRAIAAALMLWTVFVALGCSTPPPPKPKVLTVEVQAAANVNPDARGRPSPVVVRVYELKSAAPFETADFVSLYEKDQTLLGAEIVVRDEFVLSPGESKSIRRDAGDSKFLAVMAAFRDLERARWRAVSPLVVGKDNAFAVRLESSMLQLTKL